MKSTNDSTSVVEMQDQDIHGWFGLSYSNYLVLHRTLLQGRKPLVPGNHDRCWSGHKKVRPVDRSRYEDVGFTILPELHRYRSWWLCHFPTAGDSHDEDRYVEHRPNIPAGDWLIHGHVHEKWRLNGRQINVGVDVWDFYPVHENVLRAAIDQAERTES